MVLSSADDKVHEEMTSDKMVVMHYGDKTTIKKGRVSKLSGMLKQAVHIIDTSSEMHELVRARNIIDKIIYESPENIEAYIALARFHMKMGSAPGGLNTAEKILNEALEIDGKHANAHVLLGYVYLRQKRYEKAESEFEISKRLGTDNLWLYTNWANLYTQMQDSERAYDKFEKVINTPRQMTREDRALEDGFSLYLNYAKKQFDIKRTGTILERRVMSFPDNGCYHSYYADYLVTHERKYEEAEKIARKAIDVGCARNGFANKVLAKTLLIKSLYHNYVSISQAKKDYKKSGILYNNEARMVAELSDAAEIGDLYKRLKNKWGIDVDDKGVEGGAAIAYCVNEKRYLCVENLLTHDSSVNQVVNERGWSLLMLAVYAKDKAMVKRLLLAGANPDYSSPDGASAHVIADSLNEKEIEDMLKESSRI